MLSNEARAIQQLFHIQNKEGVKVPFILTPAQQFLDEEETNRIIIAKARQKGFSSGIKGKFTIRCLGKDGTHAVIMSHEAGATQRHMDQVQYLLKHMKGPKPVFGRNSRGELYFPKTESTFYIGTAGSKAFGRGDWITDLHCSEYAWWEDAIKHQAGVFQAVPRSGRIVLESTGNGRNNDFYYIWKHADDMGYKRLFYGFFMDDEYTLPVSNWKPDCPKYNGYLLDLKHKHNLSDQTMAWYEAKFKELREDLKLMQQEYPSTPEECFQATGGALFLVEEAYSSLWVTKRLMDYYVNLLEGHPSSNYQYIIGCDPSGGTGNDDTSISIFCTQTGEQVLELFNPHINPIQCGRLLVDLGNLYNKAYIITEGNNHGAAVIPWLKENYDRQLIFKSKLPTASSPAKYGWWNSNISKHVLVGLILEEIPQTIFYGKQTVDELNSFEETPEGRLEGKSDNCVISTGLAMMGLKKYQYLRGTHIPKPIAVKAKLNYMTYTLDEVLENIGKRKQGNSYLGNQVGVGYS
jgi:hypothetical protein